MLTNPLQTYVGRFSLVSASGRNYYARQPGRYTYIKVGTITGAATWLDLDFSDGALTWPDQPAVWTFWDGGTPSYDRGVVLCNTDIQSDLLSVTSLPAWDTTRSSFAATEAWGTEDNPDQESHFTTNGPRDRLFAECGIIFDQDYIDLASANSMFAEILTLTDFWPGYPLSLWIHFNTDINMEEAPGTHTIVVAGLTGTGGALYPIASYTAAELVSGLPMIFRMEWVCSTTVVTEGWSFTTEPDAELYIWIDGTQVLTGSTWVDIADYVLVPIDFRRYQDGTVQIVCDVWSGNEDVQLKVRLWSVTTNASLGESDWVTGSDPDNPTDASFSVTGTGTQTCKMQIRSDPPGEIVYCQSEGMAKIP